MKKCELNDNIKVVTDMLFGTMGTNMLDNKDEDALKTLTVIKLARKFIVEQNDDIEELKNKLDLMDDKMNKILYEISRSREKA